VVDLLTRYWILFDIPPDQPVSIIWYRTGCGVTGYSYDDALDLLREFIFEPLGKELPSIRALLEHIDVSTVVENHIRTNISVPVWRGVWFPR
jgi:hypothetical protein